MMRFDDVFRDGILSNGWSCKSLTDSKADWVASDLFINACDHFMPSRACILNEIFYCCRFFFFIDDGCTKKRVH